MYKLLVINHQAFLKSPPRGTPTPECTCYLCDTIFRQYAPGSQDSCGLRRELPRVLGPQAPSGPVFTAPCCMSAVGVSGDTYSLLSSCCALNSDNLSVRRVFQAVKTGPLGMEGDGSPKEGRCRGPSWRDSLQTPSKHFGSSLAGLVCLPSWVCKSCRSQ